MASLKKLEQRILEIIQQRFPVASRPYLEMANELGASEDEVFEAVQNLRTQGIIRRLGGSFDSRKIGYKSTLAALSVPEERLDEAVAIVNSYPSVTHNYEREGLYNVWFTVIDESNEKIERTLHEIQKRTGAPVLNLPASHMFKIQVDFDLGSDEEE
ncbi:MAG: Lrp/AsnC family transcriptional regulator [Candidatus Abyssubacteria bacterium]